MKGGEQVEVIIKATPKEIAALVVELQRRQDVDAPTKREPVKLEPGMLLVLDVR